MITITWQEDGKPAEVFTIADAVVQSLERHRLALTEAKSGPDPAFGKPGGPREEFTYGPKHETIGAMVVGHLRETMVSQVLRRYPTPEIAALNAKAMAAQNEMACAHAAAVARAGTSERLEAASCNSTKH